MAEAANPRQGGLPAGETPDRDESKEYRKALTLIKAGQWEKAREVLEERGEFVGTPLGWLRASDVAVVRRISPPASSRPNVTPSFISRRKRPSSWICS